MSELKSLEKLRTAARNMAKGSNLESHEECNLLLIIADEIEHEIAERYMEMPFDSDGVLIKLGDRLVEHEDGHEFTVNGVQIWGNTYEWWAYQENGIQAPAMRCTHAKSRTLEDMLCDLEGLRGNGAMYEDVVTRAAELAQEIRELMEVNE